MGTKKITKGDSFWVSAAVENHFKVRIDEKEFIDLTAYQAAALIMTMTATPAKQKQESITSRVKKAIAVYFAEVGTPKIPEKISTENKIDNLPDPKRKKVKKRSVISTYLGTEFGNEFRLGCLPNLDLDGAKTIGDVISYVKTRLRDVTNIKQTIGDILRFYGVKTTIPWQREKVILEEIKPYYTIGLDSIVDLDLKTLVRYAHPRQAE